MTISTKRHAAELKHLGELIASTLGSGYTPTLARPEQQATADAYDATMAALGRPERAWRGSRRAA